MGSIDDMKKRMKIDDIDVNQRKKLFNDFVDKGGQVINDRKKKKPIQFDRNKQKQYKDLEKKKREQNKSKPDAARKTYSPPPAKKQTYSASTPSVRQGSKRKFSFQVFLQGVFSGTFTLTRRFNTNFSNEVFEGLSEIFKDLNQITTFFLSMQDEDKWVAFDEINQISPFGYELIMIIHNMVNKENFKPIKDFFEKDNNIKCPEIINNLLVFLKPAVLLYPSQDILKKLVFKAETIYNETTELEISIPKAKINKELDKIFSYFMPRFFTIIVYNQGHKIKAEYNEMYKFINIKSSEDIGTLTQELSEQKESFIEEKQRQAREAQRKEQHEKEQKEEKKVPKYVQTGLKIIDQIIKGIPLKKNRDKIGAIFEENEKMLEFYYLFRKYDERHSFIMTTFQIEFEPILKDRVRIDIKRDLELLNNNFNEILNLIKEYAKIMEDFHYVNNDAKLKEHLKDQQLNSIKKRRMKTFSEIKIKSAAFFRKKSVVLQEVIKDYNEEKRLVENPEDILRFQLGKDQKHFFENVTVIKAILVTFSVAAAYCHYLTSGPYTETSLYFKEVPLETEITPKDTKKKSPTDAATATKDSPEKTADAEKKQAAPEAKEAPKKQPPVKPKESDGAKDKPKKAEQKTKTVSPIEENRPPKPIIDVDLSDDND